MIELILVIVVLGILAAMAIPRLQRDLRQEATDNLVAALRYTQNLALIDDKTNPRDSQWQQTLWHIRFNQYTDGNGNTRWFYTISSNMDHNSNVDKNETVVDPANGKYMYNLAGDSTVGEDESPNIFIGKKYGIDTVSFSGGCAGIQHVAFDHLGRPHTGIYGAGNDYATYMNSDCNITFGFESSDIADLIITISKETGMITVQ